MVRIGELNKRITIQSLTTTINANGFEEQTWSDFATVWTGVSNLFGSEFFQAQAVQAQKTVKFTIRYLSGITTDMRIVFDSKYYNIIFVDNIKYSNTFMEIKAMEVE